MAKDYVTLDQLPEDDRQFIAQTKSDVLGIAGEFTGFRVKVAKLAPIVIGRFNNIVARLGAEANFGLADFARLYDPSVPTHAANNNDGDGYRINGTYMALDYMKRSLKRGKKTSQGKFNPLGLLAKFERMIATFLQVAAPETEAAVYTAVAQVFGMNKKQTETLKNRVEECDPILDLSGLVAAPIDLSLAHVGPVAVSTAADKAAAAVVEGAISGEAPAPAAPAAPAPAEDKTPTAAELRRMLASIEGRKTAKAKAKGKGRRAA